MEKIDYSTYDVDSDILSDNIVNLINNKDPYLLDEIIDHVKIFNVSSPFILADNYFDLREANNETYEIGVIKTKVITFNGGAFYSEYIKDESVEDNIIINGNDEEGYSIFILK